jgi:serine/threonine-protein kinase
MPADRHLLFGLLALQNGLINQGQLMLAFQAWTLDKSKSLADHLEARGVLTAAKRALLDALAEVHLEAHDGDVEESLAAVPANRSTRASLAALGEPEIEATLARVALAKNGHATEVDDDRDHDPDRTAGLSVGAATGDGQRFRLLRPHARGGLGEVFVALDAELHREVALKQILESQADDPVSRQRFVAEAEITGGLEHPGVVPVYGLGTYGGGRPYYAMRFIKGDSLKEAIERFHANPTLKNDSGHRSLELRKLLRRFVDVCNAIDYAHSRGVIHRDIKPANIILGRHGETLVVDWGLAKAIGRADPSGGEQTIAPSSSGSSETLPGSALGTPAYMSPEQAAGDLDRLAPRSDVYSLGATLYCLLTGKPPFEGDDIGEILRRVQAGDFRAPWEVDPSLDKALDAVCKKAMATKPEGRYASGRALAEDVERWSADEPVSACREPMGRRARRWARRHWPLVTAAAAAVLVALAGLGAVLAVQRGANRALAAKNAALDQANVDLREAVRQKDMANAALGEANGRVLARFDLAREAIRSFKAGVEEEEALKEDRLRPLRDKLLGSARRFYDRLGELLRDQRDAGSKGVLADSYAELGELIDRIGQRPEALEAYKTAVAIRRELAAQPGAAAVEGIRLSQALDMLGEEAFELGDHAGSLAAHDEARALAEPLAAGTTATIEARRVLGSAHQGVGVADQATGKIAEALAAFRRARETREALVRDAAAVPDDRKKLADTYNWVGDLLERTGDLAGALAEQRRNQEMFRALAAEHPEVPSYRRDLAVSHARVGDLLEKTGNPAAALAEQRRFQELFRALAAEHPAVLRYRRNLAVSHNRVGLLLEATGDLAGALAEQRRYQELMRALAAEHPDVPDYRVGLAVSHTRVGGLLTTAGKPALALPELESARSLLEDLARAGPTVPDYRDRLAAALNAAGGALRDLGRPGEAHDRHARAVALADGLASAYPKVPAYRARLAEGLRLLDGLELAAGAGAHRAVGLLEALPARDARQWFSLACARATLAAAARRDGPGPSSAEASVLADRAIDDLRRAAAMGYRSPAAYRHEPALAPLRGRDDFRLLLFDLAFPAEPFAR